MSNTDIEKSLDNPIIISDGLKVQDEEIKETLTPRQEKFCQIYAGDSSCFGSGVKSYLEVYDIDRSKKGRYDTARTCASQLLRNPKVFNRINDLLEEQGLNDQFADKQLLFLMSQHDDKGSKMQAIREYNSLKARIEKGRQKALDDKEITPTAITNVNVIIGGENKANIIE